MPDDPIADRQQRAREAGQDEFSSSYGGMLSRADMIDAIDAAIEVATQVKITDDIVNAARRASTIGFETPSGLIAAFRAAGFEVVE